MWDLYAIQRTHCSGHMIPEVIISFLGLIHHRSISLDYNQRHRGDVALTYTFTLFFHWFQELTVSRHDECII